MSGAAAAAAAVAEQRRREEEEMTNYTDDDLKGDWEFKIVRSTTAAFRNPEVLQKACAEEAEAGWVLLEKFDNQRLRFKRRTSARAGDSALGFDPYRTYYGISSAALTTIIVFCILLGLALFMGIVALIAAH